MGFLGMDIVFFFTGLQRSFSAGRVCEKSGDGWIRLSANRMGTIFFKDVVRSQSILIDYTFSPTSVVIMYSTLQRY